VKGQFNTSILAVPRGAALLFATRYYQPVAIVLYGTRINGQRSDEGMAVPDRRTAPSLLLTRDKRDDAGDDKPWWAATLIGQRQRPTPWTRPIFDNRCEV